MLLWYLLDVLGILLFTNSQGISTSPKRGLVHLPSKYDADDQLWNPPTSDLTWYYNYGSTPSQAYAGSSKLQFVPMLFAAANSQNDVVFLNDVISRMKTGYNISYVLSFQEPDASNTKASSTQVELAVQAWVREMEPLKKFGAKLGAPAVTATPAGFSWLQQFFTACKGKCSIDFIPIHWYGDFAGLTSHIDRVRAVYPNLTIWVTEFADKDASLAESQSFYNQSTQYFDQTDYITHYSYYGSFRSDVSTIGPNAAMLTQTGRLTDIGSWYLGGMRTSNRPKGISGRNQAFTLSGLFVLFASAVWLFI